MSWLYEESKFIFRFNINKRMPRTNYLFLNEVEESFDIIKDLYKKYCHLTLNTI